jgi:hypothetical protein
MTRRVIQRLPKEVGDFTDDAAATISTQITKSRPE